MDTVKEKITMLLVPKLEELDCFLVDVRVNPSGNKYEVFIDNDNGVQIYMCEQVSRYIELHLDNDESIPANYSLDVSSPGMDNPFKVMRQYKKNKGKTIEIVLNSGEKIEGILKDVTDEKISLEVHHPPKKRGMKPDVTEADYLFNDIKTTKKKITF